jgi:hypothetical protein
LYLARLRGGGLRTRGKGAAQIHHDIRGALVALIGILGQKLVEGPSEPDA